MNQPADQQPEPSATGASSSEWGEPVYSGWSQPPITEVYDEPWRSPNGYDEPAPQLTYPTAPIPQLPRKLPWILG